MTTAIKSRKHTSKPVYTQEQRDAFREASNGKKDELVASIDAAITAISTDDDFLRLLELQSQFHRYSWSNTWLIHIQRPDATQVAGYTTWAKLKRFVRKGEKGIAILAPLVFRRIVTAEDGSDAEYRGISGFRVVYVFDVSQTEGEPLPDRSCPALQGSDGADLYVALSQVAQNEGVSIECQPIAQPELYGWYEPDRKHIVVRNGDTSKLQQVKTLAHELAHHVHIQHHGSESQQRDERETIAEAVAFVVLRHYGLDSTARSFPYIAGWTKDIPAFKKALTTIHKVSMHIIEALDGTTGAQTIEAEVA